MLKKFLLTIVALAISPLSSPASAMKIPGLLRKQQTEEKYEGYYENNNNNGYNKYVPKNDLQDRIDTVSLQLTFHQDLNEYKETPYETFHQALQNVTNEDIQFIYGEEWSKKDFQKLNHKANVSKHGWNNDLDNL